MSKATLAKKLVEILKEVETVKKSGVNSHQKYQYTTESDLLEALRPLLVEKGVFIFSSVVEVTKVENITTVIMEHTFTDSESGESMAVRSAGQGADKQDKGVYKAITGANKYFLWKNFLIESNDDPENDNANPSYSKGTGGNKATPSKSISASGGSGFLKKNTPALKAESNTETPAASPPPVETPAKPKFKRMPTNVQ